MNAAISHAVKASKVNDLWLQTPELALTRQVNRQQRSHADMIVYVRLHRNDLQRTVPFCVHDPRCVVLTPALFDEIRMHGTLGIPADVSYEDHLSYVFTIR